MFSGSNPRWSLLAHKRGNVKFSTLQGHGADVINGEEMWRGKRKPHTAHTVHHGFLHFFDLVDFMCRHLNDYWRLPPRLFLLSVHHHQRRKEKEVWYDLLLLLLLYNSVSYYSSVMPDPILDEVEPMSARPQAQPFVQSRTDVYFQTFYTHPTSPMRSWPFWPHFS